MGCISVPQDLSSLGGSSCLLDKVANLLCKIIRKHLESFLTNIINELEIIIDWVLVLRKKYYICFYYYIHFLLFYFTSPLYCLSCFIVVSVYCY